MGKRMFLSATSMAYYGECAYKFFMSRIWRVVKAVTPVYFQVGDEMHKILAGELKEADVRHAEAVLLARKIKVAEAALELDVSKRELWDRLKLDGMQLKGGKLLGNITVTRVIDVMCKDWNGKPLIVDYKSAKNPWEEIQNKKGVWIAPLALGVQSILYTLRGPTQRGVWPSQLMYLVATKTKRGDVRRYMYHRDTDRTQNLLKRIWRIEQDWLNEDFTKNEGYYCGQCPWAAACYQTAGWEEFYTPMDKKK